MARGGTSSKSGSSTPVLRQYEQMPVPPTAGKTGRLWHSSSSPTLEPHCRPAENLPGIKSVKIYRAAERADQLPPCIWSDGYSHMVDESWPTHAVPLFVFYGEDRPRPRCREEIRFTIKDEKYVNYCVRLRCGGGDRYMGGSIGMVHCPDRREALYGQEGQLATILDITVNPDSTVQLHIVGDQQFIVQKAWMPRGMRDLQYAVVEVQPAKALREQSIMEATRRDPSLWCFARLLELAAPGLAEELEDPAKTWTLFAPTNEAVEAAFGPMSDEEIEAAKPNLEQILAGATSCGGGTLVSPCTWVEHYPG